MKFDTNDTLSCIRIGHNCNQENNQNKDQNRDSTHLTTKQKDKQANRNTMNPILHPRNNHEEDCHEHEGF